MLSANFYKSNYLAMARCQECDDVLVGGVGLAACQLAGWKGLHVTATAGTEQGMQLVKENGANAVYNHREQGYLDKLKKDFKEGRKILKQK